MFLLTTAIFPNATEMGDVSIRELADYGDPRLFQTEQRAWDAAERIAAEYDAPEHSGAGDCRVFAAADWDGTPDGAIWAFVRPISFG